MYLTYLKTAIFLNNSVKCLFYTYKSVVPSIMKSLDTEKKYFGRISYHSCDGKGYVINYVTLQKIYQIIDRLWEEAQEIDRLWEKAQEMEKEVSEKEIFLKHYGCFVITKNNDYFQGNFDNFFAPSGGFYLEYCVSEQRYWQTLPQTCEEVKNLIYLWLSKSENFLTPSWQLIGDEEEPISLDHSSRRSFKVKYLLAQYAQGERSFCRQNMSKENLLGVDLAGADFRGVSFIEALLNNANLARTKLGGANLKYANLLGTDLRQTDLIEASLTGAFYDDDTEFPSGFDPEQAGMIYIDHDEYEDYQTGYDLYKIDFYKKSSFRFNFR